jgi:hypothetical protein
MGGGGGVNANVAGGGGGRPCRGPPDCTVRQADTVTPSDGGEAGGVEGSRRLFLFLCSLRSLEMTALTANGEIPRLAALARNDRLEPACRTPREAAGRSDSR